MNIFALDLNPKLAASYHSDKHCVKQIVEVAQIIMSNVHISNGYTRRKDFTPEYIRETFFDFPRRDAAGDPHPYGLTHYNHPSTKWARESRNNFLWSLNLGLELCREYTLRYNKVHKSETILMWVLNKHFADRFPDIGLTPFALAMPEELHNIQHVQNLLRLVGVKSCGVPEVDAYRAYYIFYKTEINKWNHSDKPFWVPDVQLIKTINERIKLNKELLVSN